MDVTIQPGKLARLLAGAVIVLVCASAAGAVAKHGFGHGELLGTVRLFDLMQEANVPTWFSSVLLLVCAAWLGMIARLTMTRGERFGRHWAGLAVIFLLLSLDETAQIHDLVSDRLHGRFHTSGIFFYAWVIPACAFLAVLAITYARFLMHLPRRTCLLFLLAGALYVGGAVGMEMVAAVHDESHGYENPVTAALATVEETMEMAGLVTFVYALTAYLSSAFGHIRIRLGAPATAAAAAAAEQVFSEPVGIATRVT